MVRILMAVDGSEHDRKTGDFLVKTFADRSDVGVTVLNVAEFEGVMATSMIGPGYVPYLPPREDIERWQEEARARAESIVERVAADLRKRGVPAVGRVVWGAPADVIVSLGRGEQFDLIAVGSRGAGQISGIFLGSVSDRVVHRAEGAVLVVH